ncbi:MAG: hypothetical protein AB1486_29740 [Planctomycetota bacterium]
MYFPSRWAVCTGLSALIVTVSSAAANSRASAGAMQPPPQEQQQSLRQQDRGPPPPLPGLRIESQRTSKKWIELPTGVSVAVDEGIERGGIKVYPSLTGDLVAVDTATGKVLWHTSCSAFWDHVNIEQTKGDDGKVYLAVALRSASHREFAEFRDLKTGKTIKSVGGSGKPEGTPLKLRRVWSGNKALLDQPLTRLITSPEDWSELRARMFGSLDESVPTRDEIDFTREALLLVAMGKTSNCDGIGYVDAFEGTDSITIRLQHHWYQSVGDTPPTWAYGIFVVPRSATKEYVLYRNVQSLKGGPPMWEVCGRLQRKKA